MDDEDAFENCYENKTQDSGRVSISTVGETSKLVRPPVFTYGLSDKRCSPTDQCEDHPRETTYGSTFKRHYSHSSQASTHKGIQEQGNREESVLVVPGNSSNQTIIKRTASNRFDQWKSRKCCTISLCCWSAVLLIILLIFWLGFIMIGNFPSMAEQNSIIIKNSIILAARADPFWYSFVTVTKQLDNEDHLVNVYVEECDNVVVENDIIQYNRTFSLHHNVLLLDPTFLIDGSAFDINIEVLNASASNGGLLPRVVISDNADSLDDFQQNKTMSKDDIAFIQDINNVSNRFSYTASKTGYFYMGFMPTGEILLHITYNILGFKYLKPNDAFSSCSTQKKEGSCNVKLPTSLTNINSDYYCVLCEMNSNPAYADKYSLNLNIQVHRSLWNMFTIGILSLCLLATSCGIALHCGYLVRSIIRKRKRSKASNMSIQYD